MGNKLLDSFVENIRKPKHGDTHKMGILQVRFLLFREGCVFEGDDYSFHPDSIYPPLKEKEGMEGLLEEMKADHPKYDSLLLYGEDEGIYVKKDFYYIQVYPFVVGSSHSPTHSSAVEHELNMNGPSEIIDPDTYTEIIERYKDELDRIAKEIEEKEKAEESKYKTRLFAIQFPLLVEFWACSYDTYDGTEYDAGINVIGILDMDKIENIVLKYEKKK